MILLAVALCFIHFVASEIVVDRIVEYKYENKKLCTYFEGGNRYSGVEYGLVNCSWYASDCCCKRTEVTAVFSNIFPLYGASRDCKNQMNYLMCYFCDPFQHRWYNKKATVCADFCRMVYLYCKDAKYEGTRIGEIYRNGSAFCDAQNFDIIEGKSNCFNFDPTVFDHAALIESPSFFMYIVGVVGIFYALMVTT